MKVFKFGGASVKDSPSIQNVKRIIDGSRHTPLLVVISAMGKTTNALERLVFLSQASQSYDSELESVFDFHRQVSTSLLRHPDNTLIALEEYKTQLVHSLNLDIDVDQKYDQVVSFGELISTLIVTAHLDEAGIPCELIDARKHIATDSSYREAKVNWVESEKLIRTLSPQLENKVLITQGFIGSFNELSTTTLGREGSDFSAAIFASCLDADSVTIWKDVPGVMSADPKRLSNATTFEELPFGEAAEMTYYGASVIHPKTIKPLANKGISLFVKNFDNIDLPGTRIHECTISNLSPLIVFKEDQCLVSCHVTDYTFIDESQIGFIFNSLSSIGLKVNLMQNSAISFSFCLDFKEAKVMALIKELSSHFEVYYNTGLTLITVKNYDTASFKKYRRQNDIVLEQSSRSTLQVLVKSK